MKYVELQEAFELEVNQLDDSLNKPTTSEIEYWLMAAIDKFIKTRYSGINFKREGFEQSQKRTDDLRTLIVSRTFTFSTYPMEYNIDIPVDYLLALGETAVIFSEDVCWPKGPNGQPRTKNVDVTETTIENFDSKYNNSLSDYRLHANNARPLRLFKGDKIWLYTDGNYNIKNYILTYVRQPKKINLTLTPFDEYTDLPVSTQMELVKLAAALYLENKTNPRYQSYTNEVNTME